MTVRKDVIQNTGFTLLEVIVTLVVGAILAALIVPYMSTLLTQSSESTQNMQTTMSVNQVIENMTAYYLAQQAAGTLNLNTLQTSIGPVGNQNNNYGEYNVVTNSFVTFPAGGGAETLGGTSTLKVTITGINGGPFFTTLFTQ